MSYTTLGFPEAKRSILYSEPSTISQRSHAKERMERKILTRHYGDLSKIHYMNIYKQSTRPKNKENHIYKEMSQQTDLTSVVLGLVWWKT